MTDDQHTRYPRAEFREFMGSAGAAEWTLPQPPPVTIEDLAPRINELLNTGLPRSRTAALAGSAADIASRFEQPLSRLAAWLERRAQTVDEHLNIGGHVVHFTARPRRGGLRWRATYPRGILSAQSNRPGTYR